MFPQVGLRFGTGLKMTSVATQKTVLVPPTLMTQSSLSLARHLGATLKSQVNQDDGSDWTMQENGNLPCMVPRCFIDVPALGLSTLFQCSKGRFSIQFNFH